MPYEESKQEFFNVAQKAYVNMVDALNRRDSESPLFAHQTSVCHDEINKAEGIINKVYPFCSSQQKTQLDIYWKIIGKYKREMNELQ